MGASIERQSAFALAVTFAVAVLAGLGSSRAFAQASTAVDVSAGGATAPVQSRLRLEVQGGVNAPLGMGAIAAVYAPLPWLALGGGVGLAETNQGTGPHYGLFARAHVVRRAGFALGPVLTASSGNEDSEATYVRPQFAPDHLRWTWAPGYRVDAGLGVEVKRGRWTARLEAGVGYVLNRPNCEYWTEAGRFTGSCTAPEIPAYYHFSREPGRIVPYVALSLGPEVSRPDAPRPDTPRPDTGPVDARPGPNTAWFGWQYLLADATVAAVLYSDHGDTFVIGTSLVLFAASGPALHLAHREPGKAALSFALRTLVPLALFLTVTSPNSDGGGNIPGFGPALGAMLGATLIDAAVLGWSGRDTQLRGHVYARIGLLEIFSFDDRTGGAIGLGYRYEVGSLALDVSAFNAYFAKGLGRIQYNSPVLWGSYVKILGLGYLDRFIGKDVYVGGGLSYGELALSNPGSFYVESGRGPQTELVAGVELLRRTSVRSFIELDTTLPLYRVRQSMGNAAFSDYAVTTTMSVGFGL
jgi:hypothetical protein